MERTHPPEVSLYEYLNRPNPTVTSIPTVSKGKTNSTSTKSLNWDTPRDVKVWKDFSLEAFETVYGVQLRDHLDKCQTLDSSLRIPDYPFCEIRDEDSLEALLTLSIQSIVSEALAVAQAELNAQDDHIYMGRGGQADFEIPVDDIKVIPLQKSKHGRLRPDWAGMLRSKPPARGKLVLPGDTKLASAFRSINIKNRRFTQDGRKVAWQWPIDQIFTYCIRAKARYGYLITEEELVVVRLKPTNPGDPQLLEYRRSERLGDQQPNDLNGQLEYKAIPWTHDANSDSPTIALALFFLQMVAAKDGSLIDGDFATESQPSVALNQEDTSDEVDGMEHEQPQTPSTTLPAANISPEFPGSFTFDTRQSLSRTSIGHDNEEASPVRGIGKIKKRKTDDMERQSVKSSKSGKRKKLSIEARHV